MRIRKGTSMLDRTANEVKRYRKEKKIIPIVLTCIALLTVITYVVSILYGRFGSFTIAVNQYDLLDYGLSLSEKADFEKSTGRLELKEHKSITNIDGKSLDDLNLGAVDGSDNGNNYLCYTFYCKNTGRSKLDYEYSIKIVNMTMDIEKAVRVRLISSYNGSEANKVDYAYPKELDENQQAVPEDGTEMFFEKKIVTMKTVKDFQPGDVAKYTLVLWLEGPDKDCTNSIIGGIFKIAMDFNVVSHGDAN